MLDENLFSVLLKGEPSRLHFNFESRLIEGELSENSKTLEPDQSGDIDDIYHLFLFERAVN